MGVTVSRRSAAGGALRQPLRGVYPGSSSSFPTWAACQARLPVRMGGLGLTRQGTVDRGGIAEAACVGSWSLVWGPARRLCPQVLGDVDITTSEAPCLKEFREAHAKLLKVHARMDGAWALWDKNVYDYDKEGEGHHCFHPAGLPPRHTLLPISETGSDSDFLQHAQRRWSHRSCTTRSG